MDNRPIGVCDSGAGGLTVVREIQRQLPGESIVFVGDTARVPYGGKDPETIISYGRELVGFLKSRRVKAIIFACGTISSNGYGILKDENRELPLFDVITPGVAACADAAPVNAGFIATEATVRSGLFARLLHEQSPQIKVHMKACPLFVPITEEGWVNNAVARFIAETYLDNWRKKMDVLVLGCTHYPLLIGVLAGALAGTRIIDMADYTVRAVKKFLEENEMTGDGAGPSRYELYATGYTDKLEHMAERVLGSGHRVEKGILPVRM